MNEPTHPTSTPTPEPTHKLGRIVKPDPTLRLAWGGFRRWHAPVWLKLCILAFIVATWLPLAVGFEMRTNKQKREPRIHLIQDMDNQPRYRPQDESILFADNRAQRPRVAGTVAMGELFNHPDYEFGYTIAGGEQGQQTRNFVDDYPKPIQQILDNPVLAERFLLMGQEKFNITCAMCHGADGQGNGPIAVRAAAVGAGVTGWVPPSNLVDDIRRGRNVGHLYNTANNGIRKMGGYGTQLSVDERWAVVAYTRTLQLAQAAPRNILSAEQQRALQ